MSSDGHATAVTLYNGTIEWSLHGKLHRLDGPAVIYGNEEKQWWVEGKLHRLNGPAIEWPNGTKEWYANGKLHRLDGPAVEWTGGREQWWVDDTQCLQADYPKHVISYLLDCSHAMAQEIIMMLKECS